METAASRARQTVPATVPAANIAEDKFKRLMDDNYMLCKEEIIWILSFIKQKAADKDSMLLSLHQPRLLQNFHHYAEVALLLLSARSSSAQEYSHIRKLLKEACYGLFQAEP